MKTVIYIFILIILSGCVTTRVEMPEYKGITNPGKSMGIIADNIILSCPKDVNDDLGEGEPEIVFGEYFEYRFSRSLRENSNISATGYNPEVDTTNFINRAILLNNDKPIAIKMPQDGRIIKTKPAYFDYVLFIDELIVDKVFEISPTVSVASVGGMSAGLTSKASLKFRYKYYIWDNAKKQVMAYGSETIANDYSIALTKKKWDVTVLRLAKNMLEDTPLEQFPKGSRKFKRNR